MEGQGDPEQTTPQGNKASASSRSYPIRFVQGSFAVSTEALDEIQPVQNLQPTQPASVYAAATPVSVFSGGLRLPPLPAKNNSPTNQPFAMSENTKEGQKVIRSAQLSAEQARKRQRREALLSHYAVVERAKLKPGEPTVIVRTNRGDYVTVNLPKPFFATGLCVYDGPPGAFVQDLRTYFPTIRRSHYRKLCWSTVTAIEHGLWDIGNLLQRVKLLGYADIDCNVLFVANGMSWNGLDCDIPSHLSESRKTYYAGIIKKQKRSSRLSEMRRRYHAGTIEQRKAMIDPEILRKLAAMRLEKSNPDPHTRLSPMEEARDGIIGTGTAKEQTEDIRLSNDEQSCTVKALIVAKRLYDFHTREKDVRIMQQNAHILQQDALIKQQNTYISRQEARMEQQEARLDQLEQLFELQKKNNKPVRDPLAQSTQPPITIQALFPAAQNGTAEAALHEDWPSSPTASTTSSECWTEIMDFR